MRASAVPVALAVAAAASALGCTLLIAFDDRPSCDGGLCDDAGPLPPDVDGSSDEDVRSGADARAADAARDAGPDTYAPCKGLAAGAYCATDQLKSYAGPANDLVICDAGEIAKVTSCNPDCLTLTNPFPDTCDECSTKATGTYCGRDFAGFPHGAGGDDDWLIQCQAGQAAQKYACPHGCKSSGATSSCYP